MTNKSRLAYDLEQRLVQLVAASRQYGSRNTFWRPTAVRSLIGYVVSVLPIRWHDNQVGNRQRGSRLRIDNGRVTVMDEQNIRIARIDARLKLGGISMRETFLLVETRRTQTHKRSDKVYENNIVLHFRINTQTIALTVHPKRCRAT